MNCLQKSSDKKEGEDEEEESKDGDVKEDEEEEEEEEEDMVDPKDKFEEGELIYTLIFWRQILQGEFLLYHGQLAISRMAGSESNRQRLWINWLEVHGTFACCLGLTRHGLAQPCCSKELVD